MIARIVAAVLLAAVTCCALPAQAQCTGQFAAGQICGNPTAGVAIPRAANMTGASIGYQQVGTGTVLTDIQTKAREVFSITDYGAVGDSNGTTGNGTNNTTAFQAAFDNAPSGSIYVPCGIYRITAPITGNGVNGLWHIRGNGYCSKVYLDAGTAVAAFSFTPAGACATSLLPCVIVEGINFISPTTTGVGNVAITVTNKQNVILSNNYVVGYRVGFEIITSYGVKINGNNFNSILGSAIHSGAADGSFNVGTITSNLFSGVGFTTSVAAVSIGTSNGGLIIENNNCVVNFGCFRFDGATEGVRLSSNYLEGQTSYDIQWGAAATAWFISGNRFGSGLTTAWANLVNSSVVYNVFGGGGGTISFAGSSTGDYVVGNVAEGGATFTPPSTASFLPLVRSALTGDLSCPTCVTSAASLTANSLMIGAGLQASAVTTTGTGVLTALGVNTGTAGSFVVNGGALGTPSSGTVTNLTGTASININGTVGATTPATGAFTTLTASGISTFTNTTEATAIGTAAVILSGGLSVAKQSYFGEGSFWCNSTCGIGFNDSLGTPHTNLFVSVTDATGLKVGKSGGSVVIADSSFAAMLTFTDSTKNAAFAAQVVLAGFAIGSLPTGVEGGMAYVTDQVTGCPAKGVAPTAGGALRCVVFYNGSAWVGI